VLGLAFDNVPAVSPPKLQRIHLSIRPNSSVALINRWRDASCLLAFTQSADRFQLAQQIQLAGRIVNPAHHVLQFGSNLG
jgi:hypothetical protein